MLIWSLVENICTQFNRMCPKLAFLLFDGTCGESLRHWPPQVSTTGQVFLKQESNISKGTFSPKVSQLIILMEIRQLPNKLVEYFFHTKNILWIQ